MFYNKQFQIFWSISSKVMGKNFQLVFNYPWQSLINSIIFEVFPIEQVINLLLFSVDFSIKESNIKIIK